MDEYAGAILDDYKIDDQELKNALLDGPITEAGVDLRELSCKMSQVVQDG